MFACFLTGMFQQTIYTSGTEMGGWAVTDPRENNENIRFVHVAEQLGCGKATNEEMLDCMRELDTETVFEGSQANNCAVRNALLL